MPADGSTTLRPIDPASGWLVQRWTPHVGRTIAPAPFASYSGDGVDAFWAFDQEMAEAVQNYRADQTKKEPQLLGYVQNGKLAPFSATHPMVNLTFDPETDGESFTIQPTFLDHVPSMGSGKDGPGKNNCTRWTGLPAGARIAHATGGGPPIISRISGPVEQTGPNAFRLSFYRGTSFDKPVAWFAATHPGDEKFESAVQQATMNLPRHTAGVDQIITFDPIADVAADAVTVKLMAKSSAGSTVRFYVREGPGVVEGDTIKLIAMPPRARYPVAVTVVAWQWGSGGDAAIKTAMPVEQTFHVTAP